MNHRLTKNTRAFTSIDLLVVIVVLTVLIGLLMPALSREKAKAERINCTGYLKNIGLGFRTFATDHQDKYPMKVSTNSGGSAEWIAMKAEGAKYLYMTFRCLSNELSTPKILRCRTDKKVLATNWDSALTSGKDKSGNGCLSYGLGIEAAEAKPTMILSMDRNITNGGNGGSAVFTAKNPCSQYGNLGTNHTPSMGAGWSDDMHQNCGNAALGDGSVQGLSVARLQYLLINSGDTNNLIAIPGKGTAPN